MRIIIILALLCSFPLRGILQTAYEDLKLIQSVYQPQDLLMEVQVNYTYFEQGNSRPTATLPLTYYRRGNDYYLNFQELEVFGNEILQLLIDHNEGYIYIQPVEQTTGQYDLFSFLKENETNGLTLSYESITSDLSEINFSAPEKANSKISIRYQTDSFWLEEVEVTIDNASNSTLIPFNKTRLVALYQEPIFSKQAFPFKKSDFIKKAGNAWVPTEPYKGYKVIEALK